MPIKILEREPIRFPVTKPRPTFGQSAGPIPREQQNITQKSIVQRNTDLLASREPIRGRSWKPPSSDHHDNPRIDPTMNKSYADHFFKINRGNNNGSVQPDYHHSQQINRSQYFK